MTRIVAFVIALTVLALPPHTTLAQSTGGKSPLVGVWKVVETQNGPTSQPGLFIFTARHYSRMNVIGNQPRAQFKAQGSPTPEEKVAAFDSFVANTGTYEIRGDGIVFNPLLAKNPNTQGANPNAQFTFKIEGQTLTINNAGNKNSFKLTRVE